MKPTHPEHAPPSSPHAVLDGVPQAVVLLDALRPARPIVHVNAAFVQLTGYRSEHVFDRSLWLLCGPQTDPASEQQLRHAADRAEPFTGEIELQRRDGRPLWARLALRVTRDHLVVTMEDVSESRRVRESLRQSEARLDLAMDVSELSMWDWNVTRDEVSYNEQWRTSLGIDPKRLLERQELSERLMLPPDQPEILQQFEAYFGGEAAKFEAEYPLATATGELKWFAARAKVARRDQFGRPQRVVGVLRDISQRKAQQQASREVELRWERAVRGTSDGLYDWDLLTGHVWYADRFRDIVGYSASEFPDTFQAFQQVLHVEDRALVMGKIRAHLENQTRLDVRCRVVRRDGVTLWCRMRGEAERVAGRPQRLAGSLSDISAQIDAEEALTRSQDFYGTILDSLPLYVAYVDREQRVVYANRHFQEFFAVPLASSRGRVLSDVIGERRYGAIASHVREALRGQASSDQGRLRDANGRTLDLDAVFVPHREDGEIQGCFIAAHDTTERRQLEAELRQSQKMEAIGRLTGGIAHDFNNLLSVMVGNLQLLARSLRESPRLLRQTESALNAAVRGGELTRRLLAFARQQMLEPRTVDLNAMIGGMYELLRQSLTGDIEIRRSLDATLWPVRADPGQIENAVLNLVINARDAMPEGGVITLSTRNVSGTGERSSEDTAPGSGDYAVLEVSDNGAGMSADVLKRVFEPFFTTKGVGKGSGLGLPMVYGFVKQSGGHVEIASEPGKGTTVQLYFPRTQALIERPGVAGSSATVDLPGGTETILIVEDNAAVRATAVDILGGLGYRVLEAANGHQALQQFMQHPDIALVFADVMLAGGMNGVQLVQKLHERRPALKVLMTSGFSESNIMHRGLLDGTIELLPKPYQVEELARRLRAKLDGTKESQRVPA